MSESTPSNLPPDPPLEFSLETPADSSGLPCEPDPGAPAVSGGLHGPQECTFSITLPDEDDERRIAGRFPVERVQCDQGRIRDLSRTGVRLERRGRMSSERPATVMMSDGEHLVTVECEVCWERKLGFMKWEYGLRFLDLSEGDARLVTRIASNCREQRKLLRRA